VEAALTECGLRPDSRAQDLSVDKFVAVHWVLHNGLVAASGGGGGGVDGGDAAAPAG
jgi:hypothetical protein